MEKLHNAIRAHGAQTVYVACNARLSGDRAPLASLGLVALTLGEAAAMQKIAYDNLGPASQAIDYAQASAKRID